MSSCSNNFTPPTTLLQCLNLLASLHEQNPNVKDNVIDKLKEYLGNYCDSGYLKKFANKNLTNVFEGSHALLNKLLKQDLVYGSYNDLDQHTDSVPCISRIVHSIVTMLPQVYSALEGWNQCKLKENEKDNKELTQWLTDKPDQKLTPGLITRGFETVKLNQSKQGWNMAGIVEGLARFNTDTLGNVPYVLLGMPFLGNWHDSKLGHALCFLWTFCVKVLSADAFESQQTHLDKLLRTFIERFTGGNIDSFKSVCSKLKSKLTPFIKGDQTKIQAVCWQNANLYSSVWDLDKLESYIMWLSLRPLEKDGEAKPGQKDTFLDQIQHHIVDPVRDTFIWKDSALDRLVDSLDQMRGDCGTWKDNLNNSSTAGPFKYGFVFKDNKWEESLRYKLPTAITTLTGQACTGSLSVFSNCVTPNCTNPDEASSTTDGESKEELTDEI